MVTSIKQEPAFHEGIMSDLIQVDPEIMSGTPCFKGTRVPVQALFDHIESGDSLEKFFDGYPTVTNTQVHQLLEMAKESILSPHHENSF